MGESEPSSIEYVRDRDPQIDELIAVLSAHADVLRSINFRLYELNSIDEELANIRRTLREALEKAFAPRPRWYQRVFSSLRMKREMRKFRAEYDKKEAERKAHMQHLAENAHALSSGRFRSRYS